MKSSAQKIVNILDAPGYVRDVATGAVLLNNTDIVNKYQLEKQRKLEAIRQMADLQREVESLRSALDEIRSAVQALKK